VNVGASHHHLPLRHILLALLVVAVWGTNFTVIKVALAELPPLLFACLRFTFMLLPAAIFLKRPRVKWRYLAIYGFLIGFGQFGIMFIAMERDITPGLASLIVQMQVFFTIGLFVWRAGERLRTFHWVALLLGFAGLATIVANTDGSTTPLGVALMLVAAASWAGGNLAARAADPADMLAFVVWSSLFAAPPLLLLSLLFEGWSAIAGSLSEAGWGPWAAVLYNAAAAGIFGYVAWGWLLQRHPAASVTPMALLVPIFGMSVSLLWLGEPLPFWKIAAAALVISGLAVSVLYPRWAGRRAGAADPAPG
jgi:O-acetylserine/cysteine efflux transporter